MVAPSGSSERPYGTGVSDVHFTITTETIEDLESVAPLWKAMVDHHRLLAGHGLPIRDSDEAWTMRRQEYRGWLDDGSGLLLVARFRGSDPPGGYAFLRTMASGPTFDFGFGGRGEVESLVVAPSARGAGIGTALLGRPAVNCGDSDARTGASVSWTSIAARVGSTRRPVSGPGSTSSRGPSTPSRATSTVPCRSRPARGATGFRRPR